MHKISLNPYDSSKRLPYFFLSSLPSSTTVAAGTGEGDEAAKLICLVLLKK